MINLTNRIRHHDVAGVLASLDGGGDAALRGCNRCGDTPLHIAAQEDDAEIVEILLQAGAALGAKNSRGQRPDEVAAGGSDIAKRLRSLRYEEELAPKPYVRGVSI